MLLVDATVRLDLKTNLCRFLYALLFVAEAGGPQRPTVWEALPTASAVSPVLDLSVECISSVKWTCVHPVAVCPGVLVFALLQI